jgi:hypothetical protein
MGAEGGGLGKFEHTTDLSASSSTPALIQRTPHLMLEPPPPLKPGSHFNVNVWVDTQAAREDEDSLRVNVPAGAVVELFLVLSGHFSANGPDMQLMLVPGERERADAQPFRVSVKPADALPRGLPAVITVLFFFNGRPSGKVSIAPPIAGVAAASTAPAPTARVELQAALMPDLCVTISATEANDGRQFHCTFRTPLLDAYRTPVTANWSLKAAAADLVRGYMQSFTARKPDSDALIDELRGAGIELFKASPRIFQTLFWELVDARKLPREIAIISEEPHIPWELMVPTRRNGMDEREPLGVEFPIGRWTTQDFIAGRTKIPLAAGYVIAPRYPPPRTLKFAEAERDLLVGEFAAEMISPATYRDVADKLASSAPSLVHFVCHGKDQALDQQVIYLEGNQELGSTQLTGISGLRRAFAKARPFVFLNACQVGRAAVALVGLRGFAASFIELGASAVIAPIWSVKDEIAHQVAETFYQTVKAEPDIPFAEIMRRLRKKAYDRETAEDTYAAYCFYGDPCATS